MNKLFEAAGLKRNPFQYRESSGDPFLVDYIVNNESFAMAWMDEPALILADAGAGKTAMRIYTARICWTSLGRRHPFPIPYYLPQYFDDATFFDYETHLEAIVEAGIASLFLGLAFRPDHFLNASPAVQARTARLLAAHLPAPLERYLEILREDLNVQALPLLDPAYSLPEPPGSEPIQQMCAKMEESLKLAPQTQESPAHEFEDLCDLLLNGYQFRSIQLLLDGLDAFPTLSKDATLACQALDPVLQQVIPWSEHKIYFKAFLPLELGPAIKKAHPKVWEILNVCKIQWDIDQLANMLRRRIYIASGGDIGSLDAISSPALRDVEIQLARSCVLLPRDLIIFTELVLETAFRRCEEKYIQITPEDIEFAQRKRQ